MYFYEISVVYLNKHDIIYLSVFLCFNSYRKLQKFLVNKLLIIIWNNITCIYKLH